jgi:hypothetical protein
MAAAFSALAAFKRQLHHPDRLQGIVLLHLNPTGTVYGDCRKNDK